MGNSNYQKPWQFDFEGQFLGFDGYADDKLKYLRLSFLNETVQIKLTKDLRHFARFNLSLGEQIRVSGIGKLDRDSGDIKLKAQQIVPVECLNCSSDQTVEQLPVRELIDVKVPTVPTKARSILICQKSGCLKHGGKKLYLSIENALRDRGLLGQVEIETTGCLKRCSSGSPNIMFMPGKKHCSGVKLSEIPTLLEKHL
jgi:(2Fe-2S) ferredoxin